MCNLKSELYCKSTHKLLLKDTWFMKIWHKWGGAFVKKQIGNCSKSNKQYVINMCIKIAATKKKFELNFCNQKSVSKSTQKLLWGTSHENKCITARCVPNKK